MEVGDCSYSEVYFENLGDNATKDEDYSYNHDPVCHVAKTITLEILKGCLLCSILMNREI